MENRLERGKMDYKDLRGWIEAIDQLGELKRIDGVHWDKEMGAVMQLSQILGGLDEGVAVLFDNVVGYPKGYQVLTNHLGSLRRFAFTSRLPFGLSRKDYVKAWREKYTPLPRIEPRYVTDGPVMENAHFGDEVDLMEFPVPKWYEKDGGRYIGTGGVDITIDPEEGWVNLGTYRVMLLDKNRVCFYISPGQHGRIQREKWWAQGKPCPVAISVGHDPLLFLVGSNRFPYGVSEYEYAGGIKGEPIEVIKGPITGLPIPAQAEIVLEGECVEGDTAVEGPFGEWTGYYGSSARPEPVIRIKAVYHRNNPIILGSPGMRAPKGIQIHTQILRCARLWEDMEAAGVPDVTGVWSHQAGAMYLLVAVSIKQRYPGHARQAGMIAAFSSATNYMSRYVVVVDDDIDATDLTQLVWAVCTRTDPERSIEIIRRCLSGPLDTAIHPAQRGFHSRAIIDACRPYEWRELFPEVVDISDELKESVMRRWGEALKGA